jgi:RHS repeat-associated protein
MIWLRGAATRTTYSPIRDYAILSSSNQRDWITAATGTVAPEQAYDGAIIETTWTPAATAARYWRLQILSVYGPYEPSIAEWELFTPPCGDLPPPPPPCPIPDRTSGAEALADSLYAGTPGNAIDDDPNSYWGGGVRGRGWLTIRMPVYPVRIERMRFTINTDGGYSPVRDYTVQYSNDNTTWTTVFTGTMASGQGDGTVEDQVWVAPTTPAFYWRLAIESTYGPYEPAIQDFELFAPACVEPTAPANLGETQLLFVDTFNTEHGGVSALNYDAFANWQVSQGTVDLLGNGVYDYHPGNGLFLDLDGSTYDAATLTTRQQFDLQPGWYTLQFDVSDCYGGGNVMDIRLGSVYLERFWYANRTNLQTVTRSILITQPTSGALIFDHAGGDRAGFILDNVRLSRQLLGTTPEPTPTPSPTGSVPTATATPPIDPTPSPIPTPPRPTSALAIPGWIAAPSNRATIDGVIAITLRADVTLTTGTLELWPASNPNAVTTLATNLSGTGGATLATLDTTRLTNDSYVVRLYGTNTAGETLDSGILITVGGAYKPGRVRLSVTDFTVPLAGLPITIDRTYDSLERTRSGDFGYGWSLSLGNPRLTVDPANNVTLTQPNGKRVTFAFTPVSYGGVFGYLLQPAYTAEPGVYGSLTADGCPIVVGTSGGFLCFLDTAQYQPTTYTYTDPYGRVFTMAANGALKSIRDLSDNTLTFTPSGITSSSGNVMVPFVRDAQGRITQITDPAGNLYQYGYDSAGNLASVTLPGVATPTNYQYDGSHLIQTIIDARGNTAARATYFADGRLESETDAVGNTSQYAYDLANRVTTITNPDGGIETRTVDSYGKVLQSTDALGRSTAFTYDSNHNVLSHTNALGETTSYTYDAKGNITSVTDPLGSMTRTSSNQFGGILQMVNPSGHIVNISENEKFLPIDVADTMGTLGSLSWSDRGDLLTRTDANGRTTSFTYDMYGNTLTETDPTGSTTSYTYDQLGRRISMTDALGWVTRYSYDALGNLVQVSDPLGHTSTYAYDANGNQTTSINAVGQRVLSRFDAADRLVEVTYPNGATERYSYDFRGNRLTEINQAGQVTRFLYDQAGQLISKTIADGTTDAATYLYTYDVVGRKLSETDALGRITFYTYDAIGQLLSITDPLQRITQYSYNLNGQRILMVDADGRATRYTYDSRGRPTMTMYPDGTTTRQEYDSVGQMRAQFDQAHQMTRYSYDSVGRLLTVTNPLNQTTSYTYDAGGNLMTMTDANGHVTTFTYDALGHVVTKMWPDASFENYTYDPVGNQIMHRLADGQINRYQYNEMNQLQQASYFDGQVVRYTYTPNGLRETVADYRGMTRYTYNARNNVVGVLLPDGQQLTYTYDTVDNRRTMTSSAGTISYAYDNANQLTSVTDMSGNNTIYTYNTVGMRTQRTLPNGIITSYGYDSLNRLTHISHQQGTQLPFASYTYTLDAIGNRRAVLESDGTTVQWHYDAANRLISERWHDTERGVIQQQSYTYDAVGNRLTHIVDGIITTYSYNSLDQLKSIGTTQYQYDQRGNLIQIMDEGTETILRYDAKDRLIETALPGGLNAQYSYDADGQRVAQQIDGVITNYLWDMASPYGDVVGETDGNGAIKTRYVLGGTELVAQQRDGTISYYLHDGQQSVRMLTDATGAVTDRYRYDAFGAPQQQLGTTVNSYQYTGQQFDVSTGLYSLRARYYQPTSGRFLSRDVAAFDRYDPAEISRYGYARANPITYFDPTGLSAGSVALPAPRTAGGGALGEYAMMATLAIGTAAGVGAIGQATKCTYTYMTSLLFAGAKMGAMLLRLESMAEPACIVPIHKVSNPWVGAHILLAQYARGKPMLLNYLGHQANVWNRRETCAPIRPLIDDMNRWSAPGQRRNMWSCDEYPFFTTMQGGFGASLMPVPQFDNSSHGARLRAFYYGTNYQGRDILPGEPFAVVVTF